MDNKKIIIVEDEKGMREALTEAFSAAGVEAESAEDGEKAIEMIKSGMPDLVLLDLIIPKKDGFEVLKEIKGDEKTREIPVVLCTNLSDMKDIQKALSLGAETYLLKVNYSLDDIVSKIIGILERK